MNADVDKNLIIDTKTKHIIWDGNNIAFSFFLFSGLILNCLKKNFIQLWNVCKFKYRIWKFYKHIFFVVVAFVYLILFISCILLFPLIFTLYVKNEIFLRWQRLSLKLTKEKNLCVFPYFTYICLSVFYEKSTNTMIELRESGFSE